MELSFTEVEKTAFHRISDLIVSQMSYGDLRKNKVNLIIGSLIFSDSIYIW